MLEIFGLGSPASERSVFALHGVHSHVVRFLL